MPDLALGVVKDIVKTGMAIKKAVETVHQNEEECRDLLVLVATLIAILLRLQNMGLTSHPAMCTTALVVLHGSLVRAHKLVTKCQKKNGIHRFLTAMDMSKQLRRVHNDIQSKMQLGSLAIAASMMEITVELTGTTIVRYDCARPLPTQPQGAVEMEIYSSHLSSGDARSEEVGSGIITMVTTGTESPSSSNIASSGLTELISLSETGAMHHVSEDNISGGSAYTSIVTKQKFVIINVDLSCKRCLNKITRLVVSWEWQTRLISVEYDSMKNQVVLVGVDMDPLKMQMALRKGFQAKREGSQPRISGLPAPTSIASRPRLPTPLLVELKDTNDAPELVTATGSHLVSSAATPPADYSALQLSQFHHPALEAPARAMADEDDRFFVTRTTGPQQQPAARVAPVRHRRHTFNMSRVHRSVRTRHSRTQPSSSVRSGACVLQLLVLCALCTLVLLAASVWALS